MPDYDGISQFHKAGRHRLQDAQQLLQTPTLHPKRSDADVRHLRAAVYLAGYAVECVLKEHLISHTVPAAYTLTEAVQQRRKTNPDFPDLRSATGHDLNLLLKLAGLEADVAKDAVVSEGWNRYLRHWQSTWRYDPTAPDPVFARGFVETAARFHAWADLRV